MFWPPVLIASISAYLTKLTGYFVPSSWLEQPMFRRIAEALPVGMLAALITTQTIGNSQAWLIDGRIVGAVVAVIALRFRANFLVVVLSAATITAFGRQFGLLS